MPNVRIEGHTTRRSLLVGLLLAALAATPPAWAGETVTRIVIFGDSLSDAGNAFVIQKQNSVPPSYDVNGSLIPGDAYARGGHAFTNGPTWAEDLGQSLGLAGDVAPAFRDDNPRAGNYAVGGATARFELQSFNLPLQVGVFLHDFPSAPSDALYIVELGGNDVQDAVDAYVAGGNPLPILHAAAQSIGKSIGRLYAAGARRFLVWNVPDVGAAPSIHALDAQSPLNVVAAASAFTGVVNAELASLLATLPATLPGVEIQSFDAHALLDSVLADPASFGLTNVTDACITPDVPPFVCNDPDAYLFWDGIHPTAAAHAVVADAIGQLLAQ